MIKNTGSVACTPDTRYRIRNTGEAVISNDYPLSCNATSFLSGSIEGCHHHQYLTCHLRHCHRYSHLHDYEVISLYEAYKWWAYTGIILHHKVPDYGPKDCRHSHRLNPLHLITPDCCNQPYHVDVYDLLMYTYRKEYPSIHLRQYLHLSRLQHCACVLGLFLTKESSIFRRL